MAFYGSGRLKKETILSAKLLYFVIGVAYKIRKQEKKSLEFKKQNEIL